MLIEVTSGARRNLLGAVTVGTSQKCGMEGHEFLPERKNYIPVGYELQRSRMAISQLEELRL